MFNISVRAVTAGGLFGASVESRIVIPNFVNFSSEDLKPRTDDDLMIMVKIPEVVNDLKDSVMVVVMQGPGYCDEGESNNGDFNLFLDTQSSLYYKTAWKAATITVLNSDVSGVL